MENAVTRLRVPRVVRRERVVLPPMLYGVQRRTQSGLEPWTPSPAEPWDARRAAHLLRRATMLPAWQDVQYALTRSPGDMVRELLRAMPDAGEPGSWVSEIAPRPTTVDEENAYRSGNAARMNELRSWFVNRMVSEQRSIRESMVLFWHRHVTTEASVVLIPQFLYQQNMLYRDFALGNFRDMMKAVNHDPAMLRYLDGEINVGGNPNENYARELMELYTMGEGHYTEQDIKEAARCLTGWRLDEFTSFEANFSPLHHDSGNKIFMGRTIVGRSSLDGRFEGDEVVDIIFEDPAVARFICRKLYLAFVYNNPAAVDGAVVEDMATLFRDNNYEIAPVVEALLSSQHFFDNVNIGAMIKSPAALLIGLARQLGAHPGGDRIAADMRTLEEFLFNPPTVAGWDGYRTWVSTTTYPYRKAFAERFITGQMPGGNGQTPMDIVAWGKQFPGFNDANALLDAILLLLLPMPVSSTRRESFLQSMLGGAPVYEWNIDAPNADANLRNLLVRIVAAPDFQLH
ncbi:MAG TPA: DUF1800 domain-containing protein [Bacteroidota bacterium]|nr:DUF1800 domain-containing protein [Bacteroidota bacterium]